LYSRSNHRSRPNHLSIRRRLNSLRNHFSIRLGRQVRHIGPTRHRRRNLIRPINRTRRMTRSQEISFRPSW